MTGHVKGKVAFITGVARCEGRAHALESTSDGADIVGLGLRDQIDSFDYRMGTHDDLERTVKLAEEHNPRMVGSVGDVHDTHGRRRLGPRPVRQRERDGLAFVNAIPSDSSTPRTSRTPCCSSAPTNRATSRVAPDALTPAPVGGEEADAE